MKKLLLIAAMAAVAFGANAGYSLEKVWEVNDLSSIVPGDCRQGLGMNGKFYINDKAAQTIYIYDQTGMIGTMPGSPNCTIGRDEAGNIILSEVTFPGNWGIGALVKVVNPVTGDFKEYQIPEECGDLGRCDLLGLAKGNLMEEGELYLTTNTSGTTIVKLVISDGKVVIDDSYAPDCGNVTTSTTTPIYYYKDVEGNDALLYYTRTSNPVKLVPDGDNFSATAFMLPRRGTTMGMFPFVWDGKELFLYNTQGAANYLDGFAVAEAYTTAGNITEPIVEVEPTVTVAANSNQINWLWAEVDADGVTIYQYYPNAHLTVYRLTKEADIPNVYMLGGDDQPWDPTSGTMFEYDAENKVYTATVNFPAEFNYFGFTTELAENNDDGGWAYIEPFRFGAIAEEGTDYWYTGEEEFISLTWDEYHAVRIAGGEYKMTVNLEDMKLIIEKINNGLRGDVNLDNNVSIADVTALIDYLLSHDATNISVENADCNLDENVSIADVTALIDYLLSHQWSN
ncbi:MAG: dockerin type I repeat-containing protein [Muribaculaceae bacterium]|nr:dockerin type I repeat-containing protein [Muribaculaceae bacterium]